MNRKPLTKFEKVIAVLMILLFWAICGFFGLIMGIASLYLPIG